MDKDAKKILGGAAVGLIAGAIAGILLAPKSGKETQKDIAKYAKEMQEKIAKELAKQGKISKKKYDEAVDKITAVYELEKKIAPKDAKSISNKLKKHYAQVAEVVNAKPEKK